MDSIRKLFSLSSTSSQPPSTKTGGRASQGILKRAIASFNNLYLESLSSWSPNSEHQALLDMNTEYERYESHAVDYLQTPNELEVTMLLKGSSNSSPNQTRQSIALTVELLWDADNGANTKLKETSIDTDERRNSFPCISVRRLCQEDFEVSTELNDEFFIRRFPDVKLDCLPIVYENLRRTKEGSL